MGRAGIPQSHHGMGARPLHGNHLMALVGNWNYPTSIRFGAGRIRELPAACKAVGLKRPLLVTDPGLAKLPMIADAMTALREAGIEVALFSEVKSNPVGSNVEAGIRVLRAGKHDGVIAWGGGSGIAVEGMRLVKENLARAVKDGRDLEARGHMLAASQMGSTAFQKGLGAIHSLSHPVGATLDTHHGLTNAVAMPYVVKFNRAAIEDKIVRLARWLDLRSPTFDGFMQWTLDLRREIGIPHTLAELGVKE